MRNALLAVLFLAGGAQAANVSDFAHFSFTSNVLDIPGRLYIPPEAASDPSTPRPLILFLHGAGEFGRDNVAQVNGNIDNLLAEAKRRGAFLYAPQTFYGWDDKSVTDDVITMLDRAIAEQNVDRRRICITGLSLGGDGLWNMLNRYHQSLRCRSADRRLSIRQPISIPPM